jgi:hypothetical protein
MRTDTEENRHEEATCVVGAPHEDEFDAAMKNNTRKNNACPHQPHD